MNNDFRDYSDYLMHYGILGMHWGIRRYQNPDGTLTEAGIKRYTYKNLRKSKMYNMNKFGKDKNHNVCYILGASGSGKSTTALGLARTNDQILHLDTILERQNHGSIYHNKEFNNFLLKKKIDINKATDMSIDKKERYKEIDRIGDAIEEFGQEQYKKGNRVIVEGVQMLDDTMFPDKKYFNNRCVVQLPVNYIENTIRAYRRDSEKNLLSKLTDKERIEWYKYVQNNMDKISINNKQSINLGKHFVDQLLKEVQNEEN